MKFIVFAVIWLLAAPVFAGIGGGGNSNPRDDSRQSAQDGRHDGSLLDRVADFFNGRSPAPRGDFPGDPAGRSWIRDGSGSSRGIDPSYDHTNGRQP